MTLLPYMTAMIAGAIGWASGKKLGLVFNASMGFFLGALLALILGILGFYYGRKYVKGIQEMMGS